MRVLSITPDHDKGPGYALIEFDEAEGGQLELAFSDFDQGYLWPSSPARTTWRSEPYYFKAVRTDKPKPTFRIGPEVCNYLAPDSLIDVRSPGGEIAQGFAWEGVPTLGNSGDSGGIIDPPRPVDPEPRPLPPGIKEIYVKPKPDLEEGKKAGQTEKPLSGQVPPPEGPKLGSKGRPQTKWWLTGSASALALLAGLFVWALSRGLDWQVSGPDPIIFQKGDTGFSPDSIAISVQRAWWSAWIDAFIDPRVDVVTDGALYASDYQPGHVRRMQLHLRLPTRLGEMIIIFRHIATNVSFGGRRVIVRDAASPPRVPPPPPGELTVVATDELKFTGPKGGPFNPNVVRLKISARGTGFHWSVAGSPTWLGSSIREDALPDNGSQEILLTTSATAAAQDVGSHQGALIIKSPNSAITRSVLLVVEMPAPPADPTAQCDSLAGSRFDTDRPNGVPPVDNMLTLSEVDVDTAISACTEAVKSSSQRRFYAQLGRAYATKAEKQAISGNDSAASASMEQALSVWRKGASRGSGSAMNFLGAYHRGTYNDEVAPGRARANLPPFTFISPSLETSLRFFLDSARNSNPNGMRNAGSLLLGDMDPPPPFQSVPDGVQWLKKAISSGDSKAAIVLAKAFYTGSPRDVIRYADHSPSPKDQALQLLRKACEDSADPAARSSAKEFVDKITSQTYGGGGGKLDPSHRPSECS